MNKNFLRAVMLTGYPPLDLELLTPGLRDKPEWTKTDAAVVAQVVQDRLNRAQDNPLLLWTDRVARLFEQYNAVQICSLLQCKSRTLLYRWKRGESVPGPAFQKRFMDIVRSLPAATGSARTRPLKGLTKNEQSMWREFFRPYRFADGQIGWRRMTTPPPNATPLSLPEYTEYKTAKSDAKAKAKLQREVQAERRKHWNSGDAGEWAQQKLNRKLNK